MGIVAVPGVVEPPAVAEPPVIGAPARVVEAARTITAHLGRLLGMMGAIASAESSIESLPHRH
jgi:hypothetical protein